MTKLRALLVLMRPPNLLTAVADILAGFAASVSVQHTFAARGLEVLQHHLPWLKLGVLGLASICLYAGGVVLNDYFDRNVDREERPERPIPSGVVLPAEAAFFGAFLLLNGVLLGFTVGVFSGIVALATALLILGYDALTKDHAFFGPLNMGLCRGANLMLGVSIFPDSLSKLAFLMVIPVVYIAAITMVSRGEVHGGNRRNLTLAFVLYALTALMILSLSWLEVFNWWQCVPFLVLLLFMVVPPLVRAWSTLQPKNVGKAVKFGVLGLVILDAALAAGFAGWFFGLLLLILLPFSILLAKAFAVT